MAINDIIRMYASPHSSTTEDGRMLALSLAEIQSELMRLREELGKNSPTPTTAISTIDTSALEAAIAKLTPLPPQNLDLNPVFRSYEQTADAIKELLGEVKTTNSRIAGIRSGGGGPSVVGISGSTGNRLAVDENGAISVIGALGGGGGASSEINTDYISDVSGTVAAAVRNDWQNNLTTNDLVYSPMSVNAWGAVRTIIDGFGINTHFPTVPMIFLSASDVLTAPEIRQFTTIGRTMTISFLSGDYTAFDVSFSGVIDSAVVPLTGIDLATGASVSSFSKTVPGTFAYHFDLTPYPDWKFEVTTLNTISIPVQFTVRERG